MRITLITGSALTGGLVLSALTAVAQTSGGPLLTFGFNQTFDSNDNLDLDPVSLGRSTQSLTGLSFGLFSDTGISSLAVDVGTALRILNGPSDPSTQYDVDATTFDLAYARNAANSSLTVDAYYSADQIDNLLTLGSFGPGVVVPIDLSLLNGTGIRRAYGLAAGVNLEQQSPVSYQFGFGIDGLDYSDTTDPGLFNNHRTSVDGGVTMQLSPVTDLQVGLNYGTFTSDDPTNDYSDNYGIDLALTQTLPNGSAGLNFFAQDFSDDGPRSGFSLSRDMALKAGALSASIGATRLEGSDIELTGDLSWQQTLPRGAIDVGMTRRVQNDSEDITQLVSAMFAGYDHQINPLSQLGFDMSYSWSEAVDTKDWTETASFAAVYSRNVTKDWALDLGYRYQQREETYLDTAESNSVFLTLRRSWTARP